MLYLVQHVRPISHCFLIQVRFIIYSDQLFHQTSKFSTGTVIDGCNTVCCSHFYIRSIDRRWKSQLEEVKTMKGSAIPVSREERVVFLTSLLL